MEALYYITVAFTFLLYAFAGLVALFAVATVVGCLVSETGRRMRGRRFHRHKRTGRKGVTNPMKRQKECL